MAEAFSRVRRRDRAISRIYLSVLAAWTLLALLAPFIAPFSFDEIHLERRLQPPCGEHLLGTDDLGRDVLSRLLYGARISLAVASASLCLALALGTAVGLLSGYFGGLVDLLAGRLMDILLALPGILLAVAVVAFVGRGFAPLIIALSATAWVGYARIVRAQTLGLRSREFVQASHSLGGSAPRIMIRHILPNTAPVLTVQAAAGAAGVILSESALSFLGLGIQPPYPSWGEMLSTGCDYLLEAPHLVLAPGSALFVVIWCLYGLGERLTGSMGPNRRQLVSLV